jgi:uncharacterized iron-regulated membrane protein
MTPRKIAATAARARWPRRTLRLRLTAWYGGLFLLLGTLLLTVTYGLVVQGFVGNSAGNANCQAPGATPSARSRHEPSRCKNTPPS